jgi:hypothetical protein
VTQKGKHRRSLSSTVPVDEDTIGLTILKMLDYAYWNVTETLRSGDVTRILVLLKSTPN